MTESQSWRERGVHDYINNNAKLNSDDRNVMFSLCKLRFEYACFLSDRWDISLELRW